MKCPVLGASEFRSSGLGAVLEIRAGSLGMLSVLGEAVGLQQSELTVNCERGLGSAPGFFQILG